MAKLHGGGSSRPTVKPRLSVEQIEMMFAHIFRLRDIADLAFSSLRPELFNSGTEAHYQILWQAAMDVVSNQSTSVFDNLDYAYAVLEIEILTMVRAKPDSLNSEFYDRLFSRDDNSPGLLYWIFTQIKQTELKSEWGKTLLRDLRLEREVSDVLQDMVSGAAGKVILNIPEALGKLNDQYVSINAQASDRAISGAPDGWTPKPMKKFPTNVGFLDRFLRGGHAGGEAYGVLGAYGSGKTSLAVQIAYQGAYYQLSQSKKHEDYRPKDWFIFTYEATYEEVLIRLWSQAATIDHSKLEEFDWDKLTTAEKGIDSLSDYEKGMFTAKDGAVIYGEKERLQREMVSFKINFWVHDMTGTAGNPKKGTGYIPEIVALLRSEIHELSHRDGWQHELGGVVIDYAGLCAKRHMSEFGLDLNHLRHYIGDFGYKCKTGIAVPFNCPVWIFHQADTKSNKKSMKTGIHHADAAEGKNFGENMVFCFQLGTKDPIHNTLYLTCSKARRAQVGRSPLLEIEGMFFRIRETSKFEVNTFGDVVPKGKNTLTGAASSDTPPSVSFGEDLPDTGSVDSDGPAEELGKDYDVDSEFT